MANFISNIFKKKPVVNPPEWWPDYEAAFKHAPSKSTPLEEVKFVVFDTETSGLNHKKDHIIQIGAVAVKNFELDLQDSLEIIIKQEEVGTENELAVHGIRKTRVDSGIEEELALEQFFTYVGNSILVGHHIAFDIAIVNFALKKYYGLKLLNKSIDTANLTQRLEKPVGYHIPNPGEFSLDEICKRYNIPQHDRHTAAGDAFITAQLFMKVLARLQKKGNNKLGDILKR
jgi:DNA polymerase-3 subunit epsilon